MRGSSVHFKRISSAIHAVSHASRDVPPEYLLPENVSLGTHVVIDDEGQVQKLLEQKMQLASRQALATKNYSPMWEGVINLPEPSSEVTAQHQIEIVKAWCVEYEKMTGHKVIRADVHLDEGYLDESGKAHYNAHAHVMCDRTDEKGKVKKLTSTVLREVQNMTANVTTLQRGIDARQTGRTHINHHNFKFDAEKNRLNLDVGKNKSDEISELKLKVIQQAREIDQLKEQYKLDRETLKASGEAKQVDYQNLKKAYEALLAKVDEPIKSEKQRRIDDLGKVARTGSGAARVFAQHAINVLEEAGGDASLVNWESVDKAAIGQLVYVNEYSMKKAVEAVLKHSPSAADPNRREAFERALEKLEVEERGKAPSNDGWSR